MWIEGPIPGELSRYPGYLMARLGHASSRRFAAALEPVGIHPRHFGVLTIVAASPGITQQDLHTRTAIDPSSMVSVIDDLERLGLAERRPHPDDRRARAIHLTENGERAMLDVRKRAAALQEELFGVLSDGERETLLALLSKLAQGTSAAADLGGDTSGSGSVSSAPYRGSS